LKVRVSPMKEICIFGLDARSVGNLAWCATAYRVDRLFWSDGYLFCLEPYEKSLEYEAEKGILPLGQVCYVRFPKYAKSYEVEKSVQIPIVDVSDMYLYRGITRAIKTDEVKKRAKKRGRRLDSTQE
jgi:hypothetical protein